jgi:hypothetical protein
MSSLRITTWIDWYRFARDTLDHGHDEAVAYANLRFVEEMNRKAQGLRSETQASRHRANSPPS